MGFSGVFGGFRVWWGFSMGFSGVFGVFFWWFQLGFGGFRGFRFPGGFLYSFAGLLGFVGGLFGGFSGSSRPKLACSARFWGVGLWIQWGFLVGFGGFGGFFCWLGGFQWMVF